MGWTKAIMICAALATLRAQPVRADDHTGPQLPAKHAPQTPPDIVNKANVLAGSVHPGPREDLVDLPVEELANRAVQVETLLQSYRHLSDENREVLTAQLQELERALVHAANLVASAKGSPPRETSARGAWESAPSDTVFTPAATATFDVAGALRTASPFPVASLPGNGREWPHAEGRRALYIPLEDREGRQLMILGNTAQAVTEGSRVYFLSRDSVHLDRFGNPQQVPAERLQPVGLVSNGHIHFGAYAGNPQAPAGATRGSSQIQAPVLPQPQVRYPSAVAAPAPPLPVAATVPAQPPLPATPRTSHPTSAPPPIAAENVRTRLSDLQPNQRVRLDFSPTMSVPTANSHPMLTLGNVRLPIVDSWSGYFRVFDSQTNREYTVAYRNGAHFIFPTAGRHLPRQ